MVASSYNALSERDSNEYLCIFGRFYSTLSSSHPLLAKPLWIIESGATGHMTLDRSLILELEEI